MEGDGWIGDWMGGKGRKMGEVGVGMETGMECGRNVREGVNV